MNKLILVLALAASSVAFGQVSRAWISGVGDDANPCTRTAPCMTLEGAYARTVAGGEINLLDPNDPQSSDAGVVGTSFAELHITHAITINGGGTLGSMSEGPASAESVGIIIEAGVNDIVIIRNLTISALQSGTRGIEFRSGKALLLENVVVNGFTFDGVAFRPSANASLTVNNSVFRDNGAAGLSINDSPISSAISRATIINSHFVHNTVGVLALVGVKASIINSELSHNSERGLSVDTPLPGVIDITSEDSVLANNGVGVAVAAPNREAVVRLSQSTLYGNGARTWLRGMGRIESYGTNRMPGAPAVCERQIAFEPTVATYTAGAPIAASFIALKDGIGSLHLIATDGGLPPGVVADGGVVYGTPTKAGTYTFSSTLVDDSICQSGSADWVMTVSCPTQTLTPSAVPAGTTGVSYSPTTFALSNAIGAPTFSVAGTLPIGMSLNANSLSGTPTEAGTFPLTMTATDTATCTQSVNVSLVVAASTLFAPTSLVLSTRPSTVEYGSTFLLVGTIDGGITPLGGSIDFAEGTNAIGSSTITGREGTMPLTASALGSRTFNAIYSGSGDTGGSRAAPLTVNVVAASTRTSLTPSATTALLGEMVGFAATVTSDGGIPEGSVQFTVDGSGGSTSSLDGGLATYATSFTTVGTHSVVAAYQGSTNFAGSTSATVQIEVRAPVVDSGTPDSGMMTGDGGSTVDSGTVDAGRVDSGVMMMADAGQKTDAGTDAGTAPNMPNEGGCGCGATPGQSLMVMALGVFIFTRRRRFARS